MKAADRDLEIGCPIVPGNDFDGKEVAKSLRVKPLRKGSSDVFMASFSNFNQQYTIIYELKMENGRWLISDIVTNGHSYLADLPK